MRLRIKFLSPLLLGSFGFQFCSGPSAGSDNTKFTQYYVKGESLYQMHCSNCHQKDGSGLGLLFPPLDTSDYMENSFKEVICLIRNGKDDELIVNGKSFNKKMPAHIGLSDIEIAQISTYIYNTWTHKRGLIDITETSAILRECPEN
jgi:mono/diheme cytochrome c family protein